MTLDQVGRDREASRALAQHVRDWLAGQDQPAPLQTFQVPSSDGTTDYLVNVTESGEWFCNCTAGGYGKRCRHVAVAEGLLAQTQTEGTPE
jgi:hypothetical protein